MTNQTTTPAMGSYKIAQGPKVVGTYLATREEVEDWLNDPSNCTWRTCSADSRMKESYVAGEWSQLHVYRRQVVVNQYTDRQQAGWLRCFDLDIRAKVR